MTCSSNQGDITYEGVWVCKKSNWQASNACRTLDLDLRRIRGAESVRISSLPWTDPAPINVSCLGTLSVRWRGQRYSQMYQTSTQCTSWRSVSTVSPKGCFCSVEQEKGHMPVGLGWKSPWSGCDAERPTRSCIKHAQSVCIETSGMLCSQGALVRGPYTNNRKSRSIIMVVIIILHILTTHHSINMF